MTSKDRRYGKAAASDRRDQLTRGRAEDIARGHGAPTVAELQAISPEEMQKLIHELHVHQIELEMQNEELRRAHLELDQERARYFDLYDLAPVGYCNLGEDGQIRQANLSAASLLGVPRGELTKQRISRFIVKEDQDIYYLMRQNLLKSGEARSGDLRMLRGDGSAFWAHVAITVALDEGGAVNWRLVLSDVTEHRLVQERLRIAAIAFEAQEGIVVTDANAVILRVNSAFTRLTGYSAEEAVGKTPRLLKSDRQDDKFYEAMWNTIKATGSWTGELWNRRKSGEEFPERLAITSVTDESGKVTHYVGYHADVTSSRLLEQQRLLAEAAQRNVLVREVHHRIKNNLQGVLGILRKFANKYPATAEPMHQAIAQVQTISVIHGLQGRAVTASVLLCELTLAIAKEIQELWQTPVTLEMAPNLSMCAVAEDAAVPIALVLNELILNAVKHGGQAHGNVDVSLQPGSGPDAVQIRISNVGQFSAAVRQSGNRHSGLDLISALLQHEGAHLSRRQDADKVITLLELKPPVIVHPKKESTCLTTHCQHKEQDCLLLTTTGSSSL
ncbi:MAG: PAS domain S-box protein [Betaproteobacteria bacterium]